MYKKTYFTVYLEDEIEGIFERALAKKDKIIAEKDLEILVEKQRAEVERQNAEIERLKVDVLLKQREAL